MLEAIIRFSVRNKLIIGLFTLTLVIWGVYSLSKLPIDAVPDITNNQVQILTVAPSSGAEDIERFVTFPVEQTMATIPGIHEIRSFSRFGLSVVTIVFDDDVDVYWARQQVNERIGKAKEQIPAGMGNPELAPLTTGLGEIFQYVIHAKPGYEKRYDAMELRTIQDWIVRRQLLGTKGVADVSSFGGKLKQYEIALHTEKLKSLNISINEVYNALQVNNQNTGGAYIDKKPNAYFIRTEGLITNKEDIENIVVKNTSSGIPILIKNIGEVKLGSAIRYGAMTRNNQGEVVGAVVMMLKGENSSQVIKNVKEKIAQIEKTLPEGVVIEPFLERTKLVNNAIGTVSKNLLEGALIVIFVLVLMLGNFRAGLVVASVIPLAMLFAVAMMNLFGVSGNLMSLGAIDFGLIVDGAVIIVESTLHYLGLRRNNAPLTQQHMNKEVEHAASKIMKSAIFGQIIILIVYIPILALVGIEGKMFKPMAQTVSFAIIGASILSLTYVPMMSALVLSKKINHTPTFSDRMISKIQVVYQLMFVWVIRKQAIVLSAIIIAFVGSIALFMTLGGEFIPQLDEGDFAVETRIMTGSSLSETVDAAQKSAQVLLDNFPEVKEVIGKIGSSEIPTDPMPVEACDLMVILKEKDEWTSAEIREELAEKMQHKLEENMVGVSYGFQQPIQMRFNELMTGARQDVVVKIYGEDLNQLAHYAKLIGTIAQKTSGASDVYVEQVGGLPQVVVNYNREKIALFGLNISDVNMAIRAGFAGESAGLVFENEKRFDMVVRLDASNRTDIEDVRNLFVTTPKGNQIPIRQLADVQLKVGPNQIQRDDAKRRIVVGFNVRNSDIQTVVDDLKKSIEKEIKFEPGYYSTYGGAFKNLEEARNRLIVAVPIALLLIFMLLFFTFHSFKQATLIFTAIPLSTIGGIAALWMRDMPFSISAGIGFIALFGVAVLNGIVLIGEFNHLKLNETKNPLEIILRGASSRLRPVLMTALVASLGFLPMALSHGSGAEVQKPLATVVIGGLVSATFLTLFILPVLYLLFEKRTYLKSKRLAVFIPLFLVLGLSTYAQSTQVLSMQEAVQKALVNNAGVAANETNITYQKTLKRTATELPKTDFTYMQGQYNSFYKNDNNLTVTQIIPFPTLFIAQNKLGHNQIKAGEHQLQHVKNNLAFEVRQTYTHLQYLYAQQALLQKTDSLYQTFARAAKLRYDAGEATLLEKSTAQMHFMEAQNQLRQNQLETDASMFQIMALLNTSNSITLKESELKPVLLELNIDSTQIKNNPMLAYMQQQINIAKQQKNVELNKTLPDFKVGYFNQTLIGSSNYNDASIANSSNRFQGFLLGLNIPLWYFPNASRIKAANIQSRISQQYYQQYELGLNYEHKTAVAEYKRAKNNLDYYINSALPNAELVLNQAQKAYKQGDISYTEYLNATRNATIIKQDYWLAVKTHNISIFKLQFLAGKNEK